MQPLDLVPDAPPLPIIGYVDKKKAANKVAMEIVKEASDKAVQARVTSTPAPGFPADTGLSASKLRVANPVHAPRLPWLNPRLILTQVR